MAVRSYKLGMPGRGTVFKEAAQVMSLSCILSAISTNSVMLITFVANLTTSNLEMVVACGSLKISKGLQPWKKAKKH